MPAFQNTREQTEQKVMVQLLSEIERNPSFTQRSLAGDLGIALGLMNQYLKRCITKGWVRALQISPRRITYFLTPQGFSEKSLMVTDYLSRSMAFFRDARSQCEEIFQRCKKQKLTKLALVGVGDLSDIAQLVANGLSISVEVVDIDANFKNYNAVLITDVINPQKTYDAIKGKIDEQYLFAPELLHISRVRS